MEKGLPVQLPAQQAAREEDQARLVSIGFLFDAFGQQPTKDEMQEYREAVKDCSPEAVQAACEKFAVSALEFRPRPLKVRAAALEFDLGRHLRLSSWKARAREELDEKFRSAVLQVESQKDCAIAEARSKSLPYDEFAKLRDEAICACRAEIRRIEQARAMEIERIDALKAVPAVETKALEE